MKLIDSVRIQSEDTCHAYLVGLFLKRDDTVKFCYMERDRVVAQCLDGSREVWYTPSEGEELPLPGKWANACPGYPPMLNNHGEVDNTTEIYYFQDYTISHKSEWSYVCKRGGEEVWTFRGYAWRYTTIEQYGDNIYFGTAGQGGYFYLLNLHTGEPLLKLKTGGTIYHTRRENKLYLLQQEKKAYLVCIDLNDGTILERLELPGKATEDCVIRLIGSTVHAVTFFYTKERCHSHGCWHRVEV